jgi:5,10-methylenetetrahydrofolate reductase
MTSSFTDALDRGSFLVTTEEPPPKGTNLSEFTRRIDNLKGCVDAVNLTESSGAVMTMSPIGAVPAVLELGLHPILQITCRDRNRIALQGDLLAAWALGVTTVSCMAGDPVDAGDHPEAGGVFDLDTPALLRAVETLNGGKDLAGEALRGATEFCAGAMVDPGSADLEQELARMERKAESGARFFQTQAVYDLSAFEHFMVRAEALRLPVLAGFILPKSAAMAKRLNATLPGVQVPEDWIVKLDNSANARATSVELSGRLLSNLKAFCQGLHVIAVGWEAEIPRLLEVAGVDRPTS